MDRNAIAATIARSTWFAGLSTEELAPLSESGRVRRYPRGSFVFAAGDHTTDIFCLVEGRLRIGMTSVLGKEFTLTDLEPETWFGEQALRSDDRWVLDALALEDSAVLHVPREPVRELGDRNPRLYRNLFTAHIDNTRKVCQLLGGMLFYPLRARLAGRLLYLAREHGEPGDGGVYLNVSLSQKDFARLSLGSRQRINKIFRDWFHAGIVLMKGDRYFISDVAALKQETRLTEE